MPKEIFRTPAGALLCNVNDMEQLQDGGRVTFALANEEDGQKSLYYDSQINGVGVVINFMRDKGMEVFPTNKADMGEKRFTLVITEESPPAE